MQHLQSVKLEKNESYPGFRFSKLVVLKKHQYCVEKGKTITGDAPKEFIRMYEYTPASRVRKAKRKTWPLYIAKTGHKWYPNESVTEYLLNQIGVTMGLKMAYSKIVMAGGQVRFLSRYFLKENQELVHGADIYAGYMNDREFVEEIENKQLSRAFFTLQFTRHALENVFPEQAAFIFRDLVKMLLFDAFVGNNDRHFYNWGVIRDLRGREKPCFSPVYDTARGLLWNVSEEKVLSLRSASQKEQFLSKYVRNSKPKIGWEGIGEIDHSALAWQIAEHEAGLGREEIGAFFSSDNCSRCLAQIEQTSQGLMSPERIELIKECLRLRHSLISNHLKTFV